MSAGLAAAEKALSVDASLPDALAERGGLYLLRARTSPSPAVRGEAARAAAASLEQALRLSPQLGREYRPSLTRAGTLAGVPARRP